MISLWILYAAGVSAQAQSAPPATATPPTPLTGAIPTTSLFQGFTLSGYLDFYYQDDFGKPPHVQQVNGRYFDVNHDSYQLAGVEVDIVRAVTPKQPLGLTLNVLEGSNSELLAATEPGGVKTYKDFSQAYVSYLVPLKGSQPTTLDFGKWYSFLGYEGVDSRTQDSYSRSFLATGLEPSYMAGLRTTTVLNPKLTLNGYLYQGYNEVAGGNSSAKVGVGVTYNVTDKLTAILSGETGDEGSDRQNNAGSYGGIGFPQPGRAHVTQGDLTMTYQLNANDKLAFDSTDATAVGLGNWNGESLDFRHQIKSNQAACLRIERAEDSAGLRFYNGNMTLQSITANYDYAVNQYVLLRLELRRDFASTPYFNSENGPSIGRTTLTFAQIVKF